MRTTSTSTRPTIETGLSLQSNALNFLRLVGAYVVVAVHAPPISGLGDAPRWGPMEIGLFPVAFFFVMSGFLITRSRILLSGASFTLRRFGRIMPAFWVCMIVTGLLLSRLAAVKTEGWSLQEACGYIAGHLFFLPGQDQLQSMLQDNPNSYTWNGSAWTIPLELFCYAIIGFALTIPALRRHLRVLSPIGLGILVAMGIVATRYTPEPGALFLVTSFAAGVVLFAWREKIPLTGWLALTALVMSLIFCRWSTTMFLGALPFGYFVLWFASAAPDFIKKVGAKNDISYGLYLYAWPVQQVLVIFGLASSGLLIFTATSMACATILGWISWIVVERRATEWARARTTHRPGALEASGNNRRI